MIIKVQHDILLDIVIVRKDEYRKDNQMYFIKRNKFYVYFISLVMNLILSLPLPLPLPLDY